MDLTNAREEILGPKYDVRLGDLRSWHVIAVTCMACGHVGVVHPGALLRHWSEHTRIVKLEEKMRCTSCRNHLCNTWRVMRLPRNT